MEKRPALGKGLSALIPDAPEPPPRSSPIEADVDRLSPNRFQPRLHVDDARLRELAESIKANGIIQPIVVRRDGDRFQIIAGERRWRAAMLAGLTRVPVVVRDVAPDGERSLLEMALIENIQREDLNPIDEALAYRRLADEFQLKQDDIAAAVGKDRVSIANTLRLLKLPEEVRAEVASGRLSMGHARALLSLAGESEQLRIARDVIARALSVRETESLVKKLGAEFALVSTKPKKEKSRDLRRVEEELSDLLTAEVDVRVKKRVKRNGRLDEAGEVAIQFSSLDELNGLIDRLRG